MTITIFRPDINWDSHYQGAIELVLRDHGEAVEGALTNRYGVLRDLGELRKVGDAFLVAKIAIKGFDAHFSAGINSGAYVAVANHEYVMFISNSQVKAQNICQDAFLVIKKFATEFSRVPAAFDAATMSREIAKDSVTRAFAFSGTKAKRIQIVAQKQIEESSTVLEKIKNAIEAVEKDHDEQIQRNELLKERMSDAKQALEQAEAERKKLEQLGGEIQGSINSFEESLKPKKESFFKEVLKIAVQAASAFFVGNIHPPHHPSGEQDPEKQAKMDALRRAFDGIRDRLQSCQERKRAVTQDLAVLKAELETKQRQVEQPGLSDEEKRNIQSRIGELEITIAQRSAEFDSLQEEEAETKRKHEQHQQLGDRVGTLYEQRLKVGESIAKLSGLSAQHQQFLKDANVTKNQLAEAIHSLVVAGTYTQRITGIFVLARQYWQHAEHHATSLIDEVEYLDLGFTPDHMRHTLQLSGKEWFILGYSMHKVESIFGHAMNTSREALERLTVVDPDTRKAIYQAALLRLEAPA